ncbi:MAG: hypothetical protein MUF75_05515 [Bacteroidia bacterium]|jgi:hypothetical protein|nr:hypothetical protein [Bacteroidia bacterium]
MLLLCFGYSNTTKAQKIKKYYVSFKQEKGTLFFIRPQDGFKNASLHSHLKYDITCLSGSDSLTINFSYFDKTSRTLDSLALQTGAKRSASALKKIFIETQKSYWHYRFSARFSIRDAEDFFNQVMAPKLEVVDKKDTIVLTCKKRTWEKNSKINQKIFQLVRYNN